MACRVGREERRHDRRGISVRHLWNTLLGWQGDPHLNPLHLLSNLFLAGGFILLAAAWPVLREARRAGRLATLGPYGRMRHPQYLGFVLIMFSFLLQWPTLLTLVMFPVLVTMYVRLAHQEERQLLATFGEAYTRYAAEVPGFMPRLRRRVRVAPPTPSAGGVP